MVRRHSWQQVGGSTYTQRSHRKPSTPTLTTEEALEAIINKQLQSLCFSACEFDTFICPPIELAEFFIGIKDEESKFEEDNLMGRYGRSTENVAKVWLDDQRGVICAKFPFKQEVINDIKDKIPKGKKAWNPSLKIWEFSVECIDDVLEVLAKSFVNVVDLTKATPPVTNSSITKDSLLAILDDEDKKAILRLLSKKYHPDIAGPSANGKMAEINAIFNINK